MSASCGAPRQGGVTVVIRPVPDAGTTAYRIEHTDGRRTGTGLFASVDSAKRYAEERRWQVLAPEAVS